MLADQQDPPRAARRRRCRLWALANVLGGSAAGGDAVAERFRARRQADQSGPADTRRRYSNSKSVTLRKRQFCDAKHSSFRFMHADEQATFALRPAMFVQ